MRNKIRTRSLICITVLVITVLAIAGCSDMPYTGSMLTADDVDGYITSKDGETYCLVNGPDSAYLTLTPTVETQHVNAPIIHIYPQKIVYVFYREGVPVLTVEKVVDTTEIVEKLTEPDPEPQPSEDIETQPSEETPLEETQPPVEPPHDPDYLQLLPILPEDRTTGRTAVRRPRATVRGHTAGRPRPGTVGRSATATTSSGRPTPTATGKHRGRVAHQGVLRC